MVSNLKPSLRDLCVSLRLCGESMRKAVNRGGAEDAEARRDLSFEGEN
jgi:hypothetical protein